MATITTSRQFGSHGDTVAQLLAERLDYRYFDKNLITGLAVQSGLSLKQALNLPDEQKQARSLVERLFGNFAQAGGDPQTWAALSEAETRPRQTAAMIIDLIEAAYAQGNVVIVGRGGQAVLGGKPNVIHSHHPNRPDPRLTVRFTSAWLMVVSIAVLAVTLLAWAFTPNIAVLLIVMILHGIATGVLNTVINSATSWSVPPKKMGDALGTSTSLESLARIIAPTLGGWLLGSVGAWAPGALGAVLMAGLAPYAWQRLVVHPDPPLGEIAYFEQKEILPASV